MYRALIFSFLLALAGCKDIGLGHMDTHGYSTVPGLSNLDTETPDEKAEDKWFSNFYGGSHGWGWDTPNQDTASCSFYSTCTSGGGGGSSDSGRSDNIHNNSISDW